MVRLVRAAHQTNIPGVHYVCVTPSALTGRSRIFFLTFLLLIQMGNKLVLVGQILRKGVQKCVCKVLLCSPWRSLATEWR